MRLVSHHLNLWVQDYFDGGILGSLYFLLKKASCPFYEEF